MTREETIKALHEALDSLDITVPYRLELVEAIEHLSFPKPQGLDEAAKEFCDKRAKPFYGYSEFTFQECCNAFKAGAKWMAEQGVSVDGEFGIRGVETESIVNELLNGGFKMGDKVIVQIRKK